MFLCAPTMRNWMDEERNAFYPSIPIGAPILAPAAGEIVASANETMTVGARIMTMSSWQDYHVIPAGNRITGIPDDLSLVEAMGPYGSNALTGYFGLLRVGRPKAGETLVVSGAAGSTGSMAAQIGKIQGCRVIGIAGGADKCAWLVNECKLDAAIDYRREAVSERLAELAPGGIDIFFDNVGGDMLQAAVDNMARHGRIVLCGQVAGYNDGTPIEGPRNMMRVIYGSITIQGFLMRNYASEANEALTELRRWIGDGLIAHREDVRHGFENIPNIFSALFDGSNRGTLLASI
ncbi:MAG: NADP-dependent oxidoreductase [Gammaproteobacteria bacterium]|nr:NADP-dependent oxidoreductase [Gammaproteobacteria bacterium]